MKRIADTIRKSLCAALSAGMGLSLLQMPVLAAPANLVNRAADYTIEVSSEEGKNPKANLVDGDPDTLWVNNGAQWPNTVTFYPPADMPVIYKAVVRFESGYPERKVDVELNHLLNNMVDEVFVDKKETGHSLADTFEVTWEEGVSPSSLSIVLSNPKNGDAAGQFWPGIAEVELYSEKESTVPSSVVNVAPNGTISANMERDTPSNLIDEDYNTLYVFSEGMSKYPNPWVQVSLDKEYDVKSIEAAFEKKDPDTSDFEFTFNVLGRNASNPEWTTLASDVKATRLSDGYIQTIELPQTTKLKDVRVQITKITNTGGDPWPALAELKIFAESDGTPVESDNILSGKTVHTNYGKNTVSRIADGNLNTMWEGDMYPAYVDFDLGENYALSDAIVYTPLAGYSQYSIYTSMDGQNFDRVARKTATNAAGAEGETWQLEGKEARYVRLYTEYNSNSTKSQVREFVVHGEKTGTELVSPKPVEVANFDDTDYSKPVTQEDTFNEVKGIISRRLGEQYVDWFTFELADAANGYDYYDLSAKDGKIHIKGNNGVSLATGLNAWLKEYAKINITQVSERVKMPESIILPTKTTHKETRFPVRYSYNFCTLSYTMAFWGDKEWREELDWLALNGVNVVLDMTGGEEVWRRFLSECGYTHQEIKDFLVGPAYVGWFYMANMEGFGGPLPDSWFEQRTELARKNHRTMQVLGMQPVLQGFCGMVPDNFKEKQPDAQVIAQGRWNQFQRPYMLKTDDANTFNKYAEMFYRAQQDVFGDITNYYATDPFHEGGNTGGMNTSTIASQTVSEMVKADPDAVWIIQSWQGNPSNGLLNGLAGNKDHALILDLYAERTPHWNGPNNSSYGPQNEFNQTPWVFCMLNNFGGRLGLHGRLDSMSTDIPNAANNASFMQGVGITPEGAHNNPILYEFVFDSIWTEDASGDLPVIDLEQWIADYEERRYGGASDSAVEALNILKDTVYAAKNNWGSDGQGAAENVVNARPAFSINAASTWGYSAIHYEKAELEKALKLLLEDYDLLKDSEGYQYDLVNVAQQVLSNTAQEYLGLMSEAFSNGSEEDFTAWSDKFLALIDLSDQLLSTQRKFLLGTWTESAGRMISNPDDFTADLLDLNSKALITTWGSINQCNGGGLKDYSNRQWAGLTGDLYKARWQKFIDAKKKELVGQGTTNFSAASWFEMEWAWARDNTKSFSDVPAKLDTKALAQSVLDTHSVKGLNPAMDDSRDLEPEKMSAAAGSSQTSNGEVPGNVLDGDPETKWHSAWTNSDRSTLWIELTLDKPARVDGLRYQPRPDGGNGVITGYRIEVQAPESDTWETVSQGSWANSTAWKMASFDAVEAKKVRLTAVTSVSDQVNNVFASAAEIRLTGVWADAPVTDKTELEASVEAADPVTKDEEFASLEDSVQTAYQQALKTAQDVFADDYATQEEIDAAAAALKTQTAAVEKELAEIKLNKLVDSCRAVNPNLYVDGKAEKDAYAAALADAKAKLAGNASKAELDAARAQLASAKAALLALDRVVNLDTSLLELVIDKVSANEPEDFLDNPQWDALGDALVAAVDVLAEATTQKEIDDAASALNQKLLEIRRVPNKDLLK